MLVLDNSYTLEMIHERGMINSVLCRDLNGYFEKVKSVHPFATLLTTRNWTPRFGKHKTHELNETHTFVEGKVGRYAFLEKFPTINFFFSQFSLFISLLCCLRRYPKTIIRVGDPLYLGLIGLALSRLSGSPLVIRVNGNNKKLRGNTGQPLYPKLFRNISLEEKIEKFVFPKVDFVVAPNQDNLNYAINSGANPENTSIFRYGNLLSPEHLADPCLREINDDFFKEISVTPKQYLLCVGRLVPLKFPDHVIRVLSGLKKNGHQIKLVFAGDGEMKEDLKALAKSLGVLDEVIFAGNQNQENLSQLNTFALAVMSPLTGRALSESALCASPIVAYDLDWQGELIVTNETGILCREGNYEEMTAAVERYIQDPDFALNMGINARKYALSLLDPVALDENEVLHYTNILKNKGF